MKIYELLSQAVYVFVAVIVIFEAILIVRSFSERKKVRSLKPGNPELANANQFAVSIGLLSSIDSIIIVTLTRRICVACGISDVYASFPVIAASIGSVIGISFFLPLRNHISTRNIVGISYFLYVVSAVLCIFSANANSVAGLSTAKIISGTAQGILNAVLFRMPSLWKDNKEGVRNVTTDTENGILISGILGVFAGGFLAEYFSYTSIYLLQIATAVLFAAISRFMFAKKESKFNNFSNEQKKAMNEKAHKLFLKPSIISLLLIFVIFNGIVMYYKQIVFPLFSDNLGFSEQTISNMYITVRCLIYFSFNFIEKLLQKIGSKKILTVSQIVLGASFLAFVFFDTSFLWASAMLLITGIACKLIKNHGMILWNYELYRQKIKSYYANPPLMTLFGIVSVIAPGILSVLLSCGVKIMGMIMGISAVVLLVPIIVYQRKNIMEEEK